jgi:hypothetical protein
MKAATSAEIPDEMCTTVPPAKSRAPRAPSQPPGPHTQWASGEYTKVDHSRTKRRKAENFMRSAMAPTMSAGVMIANISWKTMKSCGGMFSSGPDSKPTPRRPRWLRGDPKNPATSLPKAIE